MRRKRGRPDTEGDASPVHEHFDGAAAHADAMAEGELGMDGTGRGCRIRFVSAAWRIDLAEGGRRR